MDFQELRAYWYQKQGLSGAMEGARPHEVFDKTGWARSVGGANPYLALFARAGISKEDAESAARNVEISELPSARGCTYVLGGRDFGMALRISRGEGDSAELAVAKKWLGVTDAEVEKLEHEVLEALKHGPLDPKEIRSAVGDAVRSLGEEGKKRGQTTTLPLALGTLQSDGHIRRVPVDGRLDTQRYKYVRWDPSPMEGYLHTLEETHAHFARHYFEWIGPATKASFQAIAGLSGKAAGAAMAHLDLTPIEEGSDFLILSHEKDGFDAFKAPNEPRYALVSCLDSISHLQWGIANLIDEADRSRPVFGAKGGMTFGGMKELDSHAIYDRGRLIGLWEYDPEVGAIVWSTFVEPDEALRAAIRRMEEFARTLGDVRSFSLDSPESRKTRIEALRSA